MVEIRTVIEIPTSGSYFDPGDNWDEKDKTEAETENDTNVYECAYNILLDGITEGIRLLRAKEYDKAIEHLMQTQIDAEEAICE